MLCFVTYLHLFFVLCAHFLCVICCQYIFFSFSLWVFIFYLIRQKSARMWWKPLIIWTLCQLIGANNQAYQLNNNVFNFRSFCNQFNFHYILSYARIHIYVWIVCINNINVEHMNVKIFMLREYISQVCSVFLCLTRLMVVVYRRKSFNLLRRRVEKYVNSHTHTHNWLCLWYFITLGIKLFIDKMKSKSNQNPILNFWFVHLSSVQYIY